MTICPNMPTIFLLFLSGLESVEFYIIVLVFIRNSCKSHEISIIFIKLEYISII